MKIVLNDINNHLQLVIQTYDIAFKKCTDLTLDEFLQLNCFIVDAEILNYIYNNSKFLYGCEPIVLEADSKKELWNKLQEIILLTEII